ncbi:MAG: tyrosine-type recombinase/integrase [Polyangiaceae bacterium]
MTYGAFVSGPFERLYMPAYRPATARRYRELHAQRVLAFFGTKALDAIGPAEFRAFTALLHTEGVHSKGPINVVRTVVRAAWESDVIAALPECPRGLVATGRKVADAPSQKEVEAMLRADGWLGVAIALAAMAGLRMGEVRALEVRDIGFDHRRILVRRAMSEDESLTPKSGHEREVPLAAGLEARLRDAVKDKLPRARVVLKEDGQTHRRQEVLYVFKLFLHRERLKERPFHSLRHYFISELMKCGASAEAVRVLAGHSKLEMTQRYAHAAPADLRAAIDKLGK